MKFLVTGIGRSGTGYTSKLLTNAGLKCGHETAFGPKTDTVRLGLERAKRFGLVGDSSWYALPFVSDLPRDVVICHQLRHPKSWIGSWCAPRTPETMEFVRRWLGAYAHTPDDAARLWIGCNLAVQAAAVRSGAPYVAYRAKDAPAALAKALDVPFKRMRHADGATPKNVNHRKRSTVTLANVSDELVLDLKRAWEDFGFQW